METRVTYLLGAGASCEALPMVKDTYDSGGRIKRAGFGTSISYLSEELKRIMDKRSLFKNPESIDAKLIESAVKDLEVLSDNIQKYSSPDTYIKSLWLQKTNKDEIEKAKKILSFYFNSSTTH